MSDTPPEKFHISDPPLPPTPAAESPMSKKTRELPNLAECQSCGFRINTTNGQDKLRRLKSEWRIVLLCGKCYKRCVHGEMCTYCLGVADGGKVVEEECLFKCAECCCYVHRKCVSEFSEFAPWSYLDSRNEDVCVDCWLPSRYKKLRDVKRKISGGVGGKKLMEGGEVDKSAKLVEKPHIGLKDKGKSLSKAVVVLKPGVGKENVKGGLGVRRKGEDDAEIAFQLHRVINSSPRISRNSKLSSASLVNTLMKRSQAGKTVSSVEKSPSEKRSCVNEGDVNLLVDKVFDSKDEAGAEGILKGGHGSCSNNRMDSHSFSWKELGLPKPELKFTYGSRKSRANVDGRPDRYMFKYSRKRSKLIEVAARKYTYLYDRSTYESDTSTSAIVPHSSNDSRIIQDSCIISFPDSCQEG